jgi:flagellin
VLSIKNNIMAGTAARHLSNAYDSLSTSVERLSSGLRINSAKDDAAGMAVRELIRADVAVIQQGARNAQDGISMLQTMEGAMAVIDENLVRMKELAEQAATGSYSSAQRSIMNAEFAEMGDEIDRIAGATSFNGIRMLTTADSSEDIQIHVGTAETITVQRQDMKTETLGVATGATGASLTSTNGVANLTDTFFTVEDATGTGGTKASVTITFSDTNGNAEDAITVNFADTAGVGTATSYTLQDVIDAINMETQNLGNDSDGSSKNYQMASAKLGTDNKYHLKIDSREDSSTTATVTTATTTDTDGMTTSGWFAADSTDFTSDSSNVDLTTENTAGYAAFGAISTDDGINILTATAARSALTAVEDAITTKDAARAAFGYKMNRLESTVSILDIQAENLNSAESRISDVDVATEMAGMTSAQVLAQAGISMLSQANSMPQMALTLLRG